MKRSQGTGRLYVTVEVHDVNPDGSLGRRRYYKKRRSHSFVRNFLRVFLGFTSPSLTIATWSALDTGSVERTVTTGGLTQANLSGNALQIHIGEGTTAEDVLDNVLSGTVRGTGDSDDVFDDSSGDTIAFRWVRTHTNGDGFSWSINETGVFITCEYGGTGRTFMIIRDVLPSTVTVNDGQAITTSYTWQTTV